jgi:hypothetical protein
MIKLMSDFSEIFTEFLKQNEKNKIIQDFYKEFVSFGFEDKNKQIKKSECKKLNELTFEILKIFKLWFIYNQIIDE